MNDLGPAQLLRVRDLADRRELVLADHDPVPLAVEVERGHESADALRDGRGHRHVVGLRPEQPRDRRPERLAALDPELPLGAVRVPAGEPPLDGFPHAVRERALRARVEIRRSLEDRELATDRGTDAWRLGRDLAAHRFGGVVTPKKRAVPAPAFRNECGASDR